MSFLTSCFRRLLPLSVVASATIAIVFSVLTAEVAAESRAESPASGQSCPTCSTPTQRTIYAPIIGLPEADPGSIVLNCRSTEVKQATPTFYTSEGQAIAGDIIELQPSEIRFVTIESLRSTADNTRGAACL